MLRTLTITRLVTGGVAVGWLLYLARVINGYFRMDYGHHRVESAWFVMIALCVALASLTKALPNHDEAFSPREKGDGDRAQGNRHTWIVTLTALAAFTVLARTLRIGPLSDDFVLLPLAERGEYFGTIEFVRPLPLIAWQLIWGATESWVMLHTFNIALHFAVCALVWKLANAIMEDATASASAAALFATFPLIAEPVGWTSGVQELLMALLVLAACLAALGTAAKPKQIWMVVFILAAVATKETAAAAPILIGLMQFAVGRTEKPIRRWLVACAATALAVTCRVLLRPASTALFVQSRYELKELIVRPFSALAIPVHTETVQQHPMAFAAWAVTIAILLLGASSLRPLRTWRTQVAMACWILASVFPVQRYLFISDHLEGSRYLYLAAMGWSVLLVDLLRQLDGAIRKGVCAVAVAVLVIAQLVLLSANLTPWVEAAAVRDRVLDRARAVRLKSNCAPMHFRGVPDNHDGAFVFRNGFGEALGSEAIMPNRRTDGADCVYEWDGQSFQRK